MEGTGHGKAPPIARRRSADEYILDEHLDDGPLSKSSSQHREEAIPSFGKS
jgi:hypothetical protein